MHFLFTLLFSLLTAGHAWASPVNASVTRAISILTLNDHQIGSGVILNSKLILTNFHIFLDHPHEGLLARTAEGEEFILDTAHPLLPHSAYRPLENDFALVRYQDLTHRAPQEPIALQACKSNDVFTRLGYVGNELRTNQSSRAKKMDQILLVCVPSEPGLSGSPLFNEAGELVALNRGIQYSNDVCDDSSPPSATLPIRYIFSRLTAEIPEAVPYLRAQIAQFKTSKSLATSNAHRH